MTAQRQPLNVAVVITTHNHARFLASAIESVLAQSEPPSEILVVDDGSDDRPDLIVRRYAGVRIYRQPRAGLAAARNAGVRETMAPHLIFLDADDRLLSNAIADGLESLATDPSAAMTYGRYALLELDTGLRTNVQFRPVPREAFAALLEGNAIGMHGTVLYRREPLEAAGGFREQLRACEDYDLYLRIARDYPVLCHPALCAEYGQHGENMSRDPAFMLKAALRVLGDWRAEAQSRGLLEAYCSGVANWKAHYVNMWCGLVARRPLLALRTSGSLLRIAPAPMLVRIGAALRRRAGFG